MAAEKKNNLKKKVKSIEYNLKCNDWSAGCTFKQWVDTKC